MPDPAFSQLPADNKRQLRRALGAAFNTDEFKTLCVDLGVDYDNLAGNNKAGRIRELVDLLDRDDRISDLVEAAERERPNGNWREMIQLTPAPNGQPIKLPSAFVEFVDQHATDLEESGEAIRGEIAKYFKMVDDRVNTKYRLGFISPVQNNERVGFQSEKLVRSLLKLNITLNVALKILAETVTSLDLLLISEQVDVANDLKTSHIREAVVQSIYRLSNIYGQHQVQTWGDRYARRFGGPHHRIQVIHSNGDVEELSYSFIKNYLLPDIFQRLFHLDFDKFKADSLPAEHASIMAQSVVEYVRSIDLYHIRYEFLVDLVTEIGIQPPHPWFAPEQFAQIVIDYDLERIQYHKIRADFFVGQDDSGSILHHCKELIHHSCSALLSNYGCYLGCFNLASLRVLIGMIEYHATSRFDESDGFFRFKQFFGDLVSTLDIDHERFVQKLKQADRYLSQDPSREGPRLQFVIDFCFELSDDMTKLITRRKAVIQFIENYDEQTRSQKQLLSIAREVLIRVPGIRFAPKQDDAENNILWAYHDLSSAVFQQISPKFAVSVLTEADEVMLAVSIDNVLSNLNRQMPANQTNRTVLFVTHHADIVRTVILDYVKNYDLKVNSFVLSLTDLIAISENQNRLQTLSDLLLEQ
ncbi:MAG: effector-associated domain EAD1-containing protein [Chloroflexota bacterium]